MFPVGHPGWTAAVPRMHQRPHQVQPFDQVAHLGTAGSKIVQAVTAGIVDLRAGVIGRLDVDAVIENLLGGYGSRIASPASPVPSRILSNPLSSSRA